jgi:tRNA uridine 5-carboxymethylaminomethyl modification enzyme
MNMDNYNNYKIIVVGAGIAGCEAAIVCAKMGLKTLIINISMDNPAMLKYNSKLGGTYNDILLNEIKILNGFIPKAILINKIAESNENNRNMAKSYIIDKRNFSLFYKYYMETLNNLETRQGLVVNIEECNLNEDIRYKVILNDNSVFFTKSIIITTGTFLDANIIWGKNRINAGRHGEINSISFDKNLKNIGYEFEKIKTYISPGIDRKTINLKKLKKIKSVMQGDSDIDNLKQFKNFKKNNIKEKYFAFKTVASIENLKKTVKYIYKNHKSSFNDGGNSLNNNTDKLIENSGTFNKNNEIEITLYTEGANTIVLYADGFKSILSEEKQQLLLNQFLGLENSSITKPGYCIEYDSLKRSQIKINLESKIHENIFFAGEVNGIFSYEEIVSEGLIAGINASLKIYKDKEFIINKEDSLIGFFIYSLFNKKINDLKISYSEKENFIKTYEINDVKNKLLNYLKAINKYFL